MKLMTLLENTACTEGLCASHGLSLYLEANGQRILFDMGPDDGFMANAQTLGVDLSAVDLAIVSHGHYDHTGGLGRFFACNDHAKVYVHQGAFAPLYSEKEGLHYIGIDPAMEAYAHRFVTVEGVTSLGEGLTLFGDVKDLTGATVASASLKEQLPDGTLQPDAFQHEHNLLVQEGGRTILVAGCAHCGIVNILNRAESMVGQHMDAMVGGFHLFQLTADDPDSDALIDQVGQALQSRPTQYYTGHCTGDYAYGRLAQQLGAQLHRISGGFEATL